MRLRHPTLDATIEVPDDAGTIEVHKDAGWEEVELVSESPAFAATEAPPKRPKAKPAADRGD